MMKFDSFHDLLCIANRPSDQGSQYRSFIEDVFCGGMPTWLTCDRGVHLVCVCVYAMYIYVYCIYKYICSYIYVYIHTIIIWYPSKHRCLCLFDILHLDSQSLMVLWCQCNCARKNTFWQFATGAKPVLFSGSHWADTVDFVDKIFPSFGWY